MFAAWLSRFWCDEAEQHMQAGAVYMVAANETPIAQFTRRTAIPYV